MDETDIVAAVGHELVHEQHQRIFLEVDMLLMVHMQYDFRDRFPGLLHEWLQAYFKDDTTPACDSMNGWQSLSLKDFAVRVNLDNFATSTQSVRCTTLLSLLTPSEVFQVIFIDNLLDFWTQRKATKDVTSLLQDLPKNKRFRVVSWLAPPSGGNLTKSSIGQTSNKKSTTQVIHQSLSALSCIDSWLLLSPFSAASLDNAEITQRDFLDVLKPETIQRLLSEYNTASVQEWLDKLATHQRNRTDAALNVPLVQYLSRTLLEIGCLESVWTRNVGMLSYGERLCSLLKIFWSVTYLENPKACHVAVSHQKKSKAA